MEQILELLKFIGYKPEGADLPEKAMRGVVWYIENIDNNSVSPLDEFITSEIISYARQMELKEAPQFLLIVEWLVKEIRTKRTQMSGFRTSSPSLVHA